MRKTTMYRSSVLLLGVPVLAVGMQAPIASQQPGGSAAPASHADAAQSRAGAVSASQAAAEQSHVFDVSGSAVHYFSTAIIHSQEPTATGQTQRSTDIIRLTGDVNGYILYHPTSAFDFGAGTLVNTGTQIFSGTIAGSAPLILHDDRFRFEVNLATGATHGVVHLSRSSDAPHRGGWYECRLVVVGTGVTPAGDNLSDYTGTCTRHGNLR